MEIIRREVTFGEQVVEDGVEMEVEGFLGSPHG